MASDTSHLSEPLDPNDPPLSGQFCDLVIEGGVINGVAYPSFLVEIARRYHLSAIGGASVGAIAAALVVACEYGRRYGSLDGYNQGLRQLPKDLAEWVDPAQTMTRIRSLFQPDLSLKPLFDFSVDIIEESTKDKPTRKAPLSLWQRFLKSLPAGDLILWCSRYKHIFYRHFPEKWGSYIAWLIGGIAVFVAIRLLWCSPTVEPINTLGLSWVFAIYLLVLVVWFFVFDPIFRFVKQINILRQMPGFGMCSGLSQEGEPEALTNWVFKGVQDAAGLPYARPLTFADLWAAPGGPTKADGSKADRSLDLRTITTCLNHGRIYELPTQDTTARLFFRLSEFEKYFPKEVIDYLRLVARPVDVVSDPIFQTYKARSRFLKTPTEHSYRPLEIWRRLRLLQRTRQKVISQLLRPELKGTHDAPDIRELPGADLPIVIAARLSMSVPILFQAVPMLAFNLEANAEKMDLLRVWFSDGGIGSNFPIHLFDKTLPRWPTFGVKVLETSAENAGSEGKRTSYVPYVHDRSKNDIFVVDPEQKTGFNRASKTIPTWATFGAFILGIYQTAKDGGDQAYMRMPDVRNRVLRLYTDHATGGALNLKITPDAIYKVAQMGRVGGRNLVSGYLGERISAHCQPASMWVEHRWVRFNLLVNTLRQHLSGFELAAFSNVFQPSIFNQIQSATLCAPLQSRGAAEHPITAAQAAQLGDVTTAIIQLEQTLTKLNLPMPYVPEPETNLRYKPKF